MPLFTPRTLLLPLLNKPNVCTAVIGKNNATQRSPAQCENLSDILTHDSFNLDASSARNESQDSLSPRVSRVGSGMTYRRDQASQCVTTTSPAADALAAHVVEKAMRTSFTVVRGAKVTSDEIVRNLQPVAATSSVPREKSTSFCAVFSLRKQLKARRAAARSLNAASCSAAAEDAFAEAVANEASLKWVQRTPANAAECDTSFERLPENITVRDTPKARRAVVVRSEKRLSLIAHIVHVVEAERGPHLARRARVARGQQLRRARESTIATPPPAVITSCEDSVHNRFSAQFASYLCDTTL